MSDDHQIRQLLNDAVSDVEPADRIARIRASVRPDPTVVPMSHGRSWRYALAGIAATAAVIGVVAYVSSVAGDDSSTLEPTAQGGSRHQTTAIATDTALPSPSDRSSNAPTGAAAVYYLGDGGARGTVLYRELTRVPPSGNPLEAAVEGLMAAPLDPDYRTAWQSGWLESASASDGLVQVELGNAPATRPASMSARYASEAVQQVVYTVQAALQRRDPVQFTRNGLPVTSVLGISTTVPVAQGQAAKVLSPMNVTGPLEGARLAPGRLVVTGAATATDETVVVRLERRGTTYRTRVGTPTGTGDSDRLFPWKATINTSRLAPGRYLLVASNGDGKGTGNVDRATRTVFLR